jgi:hypothetical protein
VMSLPLLVSEKAPDVGPVVEQSLGARPASASLSPASSPGPRASVPSEASGNVSSPTLDPDPLPAEPGPPALEPAAASPLDEPDGASLLELEPHPRPNAVATEMTVRSVRS